MSDLVMHHYFGREVLNALPPLVKEKIINLDLYDFATAGPDPFFFTSFLKKDLNKPSMEFGNYMHNNDTKKFFLELIEITKKNNDMFEYLCGFLTHYYLDSTVHPYIFHKTGLYKEEDANSLIYRGLHTKLERAMDCYIIEKYYHCNPYRFKIKKNILKLSKLDLKFKESLDELYYNIYNKKEGFTLVNKALQDQRKFYAFIYDPFGVKNKILTLLDNKKSSTSFKVLSYYGKKINDIDIFNESHNAWNNPCDLNLVSCESFFDLFDKAKEQCSQTINVIYKYIFTNEAFDWNMYFPNKSYLTGLDCTLKLPMLYFNNIFK